MVNYGNCAVSSKDFQSDRFSDSFPLAAATGVLNWTVPDVAFFRLGRLTSDDGGIGHQATSTRRAEANPSANLRRCSFEKHFHLSDRLYLHFLLSFHCMRMNSTPSRMARRQTGTPRRTPLRQIQRTTPLRVLQPSVPSTCSPKPKAQAHNVQGEEGIQVVIRMRPLNAMEHHHRRTWKVLPKYSSITQTTADEQPLPDRITGRTFFTFDKTFGEETTTRQVYDSSVLNIVKSVCTGLNGTIFAYGQTSSGKTFTMQGSGTIQEGSSTSAGIIHMAASDIFEHIASHPDRIFLVRASFLEIYNEDVRDLLSSDNKSLPVREDPRRGVFVQCKEEVVTDMNSLLAVLAQGEKSRAFAATAMNERSSRSHTIFRITMESRTKLNGDDDEEEDGAVLVSTLNLVDLAGSESVRHTGATGERQKEGAMINTSLLTLSRVMVALGTPNAQHVNFRDSKLTRILQPSLSGNARMAVICCATPSELYLEETRSTLQFAARAKLVKTRAKVNEILDDRSLIRRLQKELADARRQLGVSGAASVRDLEQQIATSNEEASSYKRTLARLKSSILNANHGLFREQRIPCDPQPRKRRFSDGGMHVGTKSFVAAGKASLTPPPPAKRFKVEPLKTLPSSVQLELVQKALSSKTQALTQSLEATRDVKAKCTMAEMEAEELRAKLTSTESSVIALEANRDALRDELSKMHDEHKVAIETMNDLRAKLESQMLERENLISALDGIQKDKASAEQENSRLKDALQEETSRSASTELLLGGHIDSLFASNKALEDQVKSLEDQVASLSSSYDASKKKQAELEDKKALLETEVDQLTCTNKKVELELHEVKVVLEKESIRQAEEMSTLRETAIAREQEVKSLQEQLVLLRTNCDDLLKAKKELEDDKTRQADTIDQLTNQASLLALDIEAAKHQQHEDHERFEKGKIQLEEQVSRLSHAQQAAEESISALKEKLSSLTSDYGALQGRHAKVEEDNKRLTNELSQLGARTAAQEMERKSDLERIVSLDDELRAVTAKLTHEAVQKDAAQSEIDRLSLLNAEMQALVEQTKKQLDMAEESIDMLSTESSKLHASVQSLECNCVALTRERNEFSKECETAISEMEAAIKRADELESDLSKLSAQLRGCEESRVALEAKVAQASAEKTVSEQNLSDALVELDCHKKRNVEMQNVIVALETRLADSDAAIECLRNELTAAGDQLSQTTVALENSHKEKLDHLRSVEKLIEDCTDLRRERDSLKENILQYHSRLDNLNENLASMQAEKGELEASVDDGRRVILTLEAKLEEANAKYDCCSAELETLRSAVVTLKEQEATLAAALQDTRDEKIAQEKIIDELQVEVVSSGESLQASQVECRRLEEAISESESRITALQDELSKTVNELQNSSQTNADAQERIESLLTEVESLTSQLTQTEEANRGLLDDAQALSSELTTAKESLHAFESQIEELKTEHSNTLVCYDAVRKDLQVSQQKILQFEATESANSRELSSLRDDAAKIGSEIANLRAVNSALEMTLEEKDAQIQKLQDAITILQEQKGTYQQDIDSLKTANDELNEKLKQLKSELAAVRVENTDLTKELLCSHDLLESRSSQLVTAQCSINELEDQLDSMRNMLNEKHAKSDEQALRIAELEQAISKTDHLGAQGDAVASLQEQITSLQEECFELKNLLSESNQAIADSRKNEVTLQCQVEELHEHLRQSQGHVSELEESLKRIDDNHEVMHNQNLEMLIKEKDNLVAILEKEKADRVRSEIELKRRMGEEQRVLLKEAESTLQDLYDRLSKVEKEAYATREQNQELRDQAANALEKVSALQCENNQLQNSLRETQARETKEVLRLTRELEALKSQEHADGQSILELKQQLRECKDEIQALVTANQNLKRLEETVDGLHRELATAKGAGKENVEVVVALKDQLRQKEERIKYLEQRKFTKEHAEQLRKLKESNISLQKEVKRLRQKEELPIATSAESTDTTKLRFDNQALESKLRKAALHCQELEGQKQICLDALRNNKLPVENGDLVNAVVALCDRFTSDSTRSASTAADIEQLKNEKSVLQAKLAEQKQRLEELERIATEHKAAKGVIHREATKSHHLGELERKIRYLEQENLDLHAQIKDDKKKLQQAMKENSLLRSKPLDDTTFELNQLKKRHAAAAVDFPSPQRQKREGKFFSSSKVSILSPGSHQQEKKLSETKLSSAFKSRSTPSRLQALPEVVRSSSKLDSEANSTPTAQKAPAGIAPLIATPNNENAPNRHQDYGANRRPFALDNIVGSVSKSTNHRAPGLGQSQLQLDGDDPAECKQS